MSNSSTTTSRVTKQLTSAEIRALSGVNSKGVSLCIPRVFANISWYRIKQVFIALNWGFVERVDVIPSGGTKRAFVHFAPGKFTATKVLEALCEGKNVKIVYDEPWYWQISLSRSAKPDEAPERKQRPKVEIAPVLGEGQQLNRRHRGRKLTIDLTEVKSVDPGNDPIAARQQEHTLALAKTVPFDEGEITE
jgi:hypothetical protein